MFYYSLELFRIWNQFFAWSSVLLESLEKSKDSQFLDILLASNRYQHFLNYRLNSNRYLCHNMLLVICISVLLCCILIRATEYQPEYWVLKVRTGLLQQEITDLRIGSERKNKLTDSGTFFLHVSLFLYFIGWNKGKEEAQGIMHKA